MNRSTIDLHCHSLASDGTLSPADLVARAAARGIQLLALTDHDTVAGLPEAMELANDLGIKMVSGIELSCLWRRQTIHVLGYGFSMESLEFQQAIEQQQGVRLERASLIANRLVKLGLPDLLEAAISNSESGVPGRPHFAQAMLDLNLVASHAEAFKKYLGAGKAGDVKNSWPSLDTVTQWIVGAGGQAVIAHPRKYNMTLTRLRELIEDFKQAGGAGIEVIVAGQKQGDTGLLADLCQRYEMLASLGSDFHSPKFPWADLGAVPSLPRSIRPIWANWSEAKAIAMAE